MQQNFIKSAKKSLNTKQFNTIQCNKKKVINAQFLLENMLASLQSISAQVCSVKP